MDTKKIIIGIAIIGIVSLIIGSVIVAISFDYDTLQKDLRGQGIYIPDVPPTNINIEINGYENRIPPRE